MDRFETLTELLEQDNDLQTIYRDVSQGPQEREHWETDQDYEAVTAYNAAKAENELAAWEQTDTAEAYRERFRELDQAYVADQERETADIIYQHDSGALQLWLSFDTLGDTLMSGTVDYYPADPLWDSESGLTAQLEEYAKNTVTRHATGYLSPIDEPRKNGGGVAAIGVPFDHADEELARTWDAVDAISTQLANPLDLSPHGGTDK